MRRRAHLLVSLLVAAWSCQAVAQSGSTRIYSCVDGKGHRRTSDRPIMECLDREQQQYGEGGTVRATLPPSYTAHERAIEEEKARKDDLARQRQAELKRRDRVLLNRYPDAASHDRERAASLSRMDEGLVSAERRIADLVRQRADLDEQAKVATKDIAKANRLRRAIDENTESQAAQNRMLAVQREERQRFAVRFDEERARLDLLWAQLQAPQTAPADPQPQPPVAAALPAASRAR